MYNLFRFSLAQFTPGFEMYVIKRDGSKEEIQFDKVTARIRNLTHGLDKRFIDPVCAVFELALSICLIGPSRLPQFRHIPVRILPLATRCLIPCTVYLLFAVPDVRIHACRCLWQ